MATFKRFVWCSLLIALIAIPTGATFADAPAPPAYVCVDDHPSDDGTAMDICWPRSTDDGKNQNNVTQYNVFRLKRGTGVTELVQTVAADGSASYAYTDTGLEPMTLYYFAVRATGPDGASEAVGRWRKTVDNQAPAPAAPENFDASDAPDDQGSA